MNCLYCNNEMHRTEKHTPYAFLRGYKCPCCDFSFVYPDDHPCDVTLYFPDETKLKKAKGEII